LKNYPEKVKDLVKAIVKKKNLIVSFSGVSFLFVQLPLLILVTCLALNREYFPSYSMLTFNVELDIVILNDVTHDP